MRRKLQVKDEQWSEPSAHQGGGRVGVDDSVGDNYTNYTLCCYLALCLYCYLSLWWLSNLWYLDNFSVSPFLLLNASFFSSKSMYVFL